MLFSRISLRNARPRHDNPVPSSATSRLTQIPGLDGNPLGRGRAAPPFELMRDESGALRRGSDGMFEYTWRMPGGCLGAKPLRDS